MSEISTCSLTSMTAADPDLLEVRKLSLSTSNNQDSPNSEGIPRTFAVSDKGIFYIESDENSEKKPIRICSLLHVIALVRDIASKNWGRLIEFDDPDGVSHRWAIPMELLSGDGTEMRRELARLGLEIGASTFARNKLSEYLIGCKPKERVTCVQQTGWHKNLFVMPDRTVGYAVESVIYQTESSIANQYVQRGTLDEWRSNVASVCAQNSRLILAVSAALSGMVLNFSNQESAGIHFVGNSSTGKSTAQLVAASVYGGKSFKQSWRATGNALEAVCAMHNDTALILDEIAEVDPKEIGSIVYMIGNGIGKGRAGRAGNAKDRKSWHLMMISSGEVGLAQHMREGGKQMKAGQEVRMIDIPADAGCGYGLFELLHGHEGGAKLSDAIKDATQNYFGTPAIAFAEFLIGRFDDIDREMKQFISSFIKDYLPLKAGGQVERICNRFALIAFAGEYATNAGITGWKCGDVTAAVATCFQAWLHGREGVENQETLMIFSHVRAFLELHGESRFRYLNEDTDRVIPNRAGFKENSSEGLTYFVLPEVYTREICVGFEPRLVNKVLADAGWLIPGEAGKFSRRKKLPEIGQTRCYTLTPKLWKD